MLQKFVDFITRSFEALPYQTPTFYKFKQGPFPFQMKVIYVLSRALIWMSWNLVQIA